MNQNIPEIRFKGFSGEWLNYSLDEVTNVFDGTHQTPNYTASGVMFLSAENIKTLTSNKFISEASFKNEFSVYPQKNDILMTRIGDVGTANVVETNGDKAYYVTLALLKYKQLNPYFLKSAIASPYVQRDIWHRTLHIAFPKKINMNEVKRVSVNCPADKVETNKIGNFFQKLDSLITQHQQKHNKLLNIKKAMLEKMFPKVGTTVPEIRFKGFGGEWEKDTVSTLLSERNEQAPKSENYPLMAFVAGKGVAPKGDKYNREFLVNDELSKKYKQTEMGDFIYSSNNLETGSIGLNNYGSASISPVYSIFQPTGLADSEFLGRLLIRKKFINQMVKWRQGVVYGQWRIHESDFLNIEVKFTLLGEQEKIGNFFKKLDTLINQHQQQITKLNNIKQACLSKMFV